LDHKSSELLKIKKRLKDQFAEVVPMTFYPNLAASISRLIEPKEYPAVVKVKI